MADFFGQGKNLFEDEPLPGHKPAQAKRPLRRLPKSRWPKAWELAKPHMATPHTPPKVPKAQFKTADKPKRSDAGDQLLGALKDFQGGINTLNELANQMRKAGVGQQAGAAGPAAHAGHGMTDRQAPPSILKILEREQQILTRVVQQLPTERRAEIIHQFERRSSSALKEQTPQALAAILQTARKIPAAKALRPKEHRGVIDLMKAAKAIRSGRLPFLPKEVKKRARELLAQVIGPKRAGLAMSSKSSDTRRLIDQHRLIPMATGHLPPRPTMNQPAGQPPQPTLNQADFRQSNPQLAQMPALPRTQSGRKLPSPEPIRSQPAPAPLYPTDLSKHREELSIPAFRSGGVASGGSYINEVGENEVSINYFDGDEQLRDTPQADHGGGLAANTSASGRQAGQVSRSMAGGGQSTPPAAPPPTPAHRPRGPASGSDTFGGSTQGGLGASGGSDTVGGRGGPTELTGTLKIEGLSDWIAKVEGKLSG